jgi:hypothetical protein
MQPILYISLYQYFKINSSSGYNWDKGKLGVFVYELCGIKTTEKMNEIYVYVNEHQSGQQFTGIVRAHSIGANIAYHNDDSVTIEIKNITRNQQEQVRKTVVVNLTNENSIRENFRGYVKNEADTIQYFTT